MLVHAFQRAFGAFTTILGGTQFAYASFRKDLCCVLITPTMQRAVSDRGQMRPRRIAPGALRAWHANISVFIAPTVLFFALSGSLQIFDLHEPHGAYVPTRFLASIGRLHKQQVFAPPPERKPSGTGARRPAEQPKPPERIPLPTQLLRWLFFLEALGLAATTVLGFVIGITHAKRSRTAWILLGAGIALPAVLLIW